MFLLSLLAFLMTVQQSENCDASGYYPSPPHSYAENNRGQYGAGQTTNNQQEYAANEGLRQRFNAQNNSPFNEANYHHPSMYLSGAKFCTNEQTTEQTQVTTSNTANSMLVIGSFFNFVAFILATYDLVNNWENQQKSSLWPEFLLRTGVFLSCMPAILPR